jgi:WD40 repeat protein
MPHLKKLRELERPTNSPKDYAVWSMALSCDGKLVAAANAWVNSREKQLIYVYEVDGSSQPLFQLDGHTDAIYSVAFSPKEPKVLASGSRDKSVKIWDLKTLTSRTSPIYDLMRHDSAVTTVSFSRDGLMVASGSLDRIVKLWNLKSDGSWESSIGFHKDEIRCVRFCPAECAYQLATSSEDWFSNHKTIKLWGPKKGDPGGPKEEWVEVEPMTFTHEGEIWGLAFSPDGKLMASGSCTGNPMGNDPGTIKLWDIRNATSTKLPQKHTRGIRSLSFSHDGKFLISGSSDETIKLWEVETRSLLDSSALGNDVYAVAFSPVAMVVAAANFSGLIRIFDVT